jgi:hypothetical protein
LESVIKTWPGAGAADAGAADVGAADAGAADAVEMQSFYINFCLLFD